MKVRELDEVLKKKNDNKSPIPQRYLLGTDEGFTDYLMTKFTERDPSELIFKVVIAGNAWYLVEGSHHLDALLKVPDKLDKAIEVKFANAEDVTTVLVIAANVKHDVLSKRALSLADTLTFLLEYVSHNRDVAPNIILAMLREIMREGWGWDKSRITGWAGDGEILSIAGGLLLEGRMHENAEAARAIIDIIRKAKVSGTRKDGG